MITYETAAIKIKYYEVWICQKLAIGLQFNKS